MGKKKKKPKDLGPALRTRHVDKGRIMFAVCFKSSLERNKTRDNIYEVKDVENFKNFAERWKKYDHKYSSVYDSHDWQNAKKFYCHNKCREFVRDTYMIKQPLLKDSEMEIDVTDDGNELVDMNDDSDEPCTSSTAIRRSKRFSESYVSTPENIHCIICNTVQKDKHGKEIPCSEFYEFNFSTKE